MKPVLFFLGAMSILIFSGCSTSRKTLKPVEARSDEIRSSVVIKKEVPPRVINTKNIAADAVVSFAETLIGVKYKYGSVIKENGFDCSGFITYVFNHFKIPVPRISSDFTNAGTEISIKDSKRGDIIGHMGLVTENKNGILQFIHTSESRGVMISGMNSYFLPRFVKVNRIFSVF